MAASRLLRVCGPRAPMFAFLGFAYAGKILLKLFTMSYFTATATEFHLSVKGKKTTERYTRYSFFQVIGQ